MSLSSSDSDLYDSSSSKLASQRTSIAADESVQNVLLKPLKRSVVTSTPNSLKPNFTAKNIARGSTRSLSKNSAKQSANKSVKLSSVDLKYTKDDHESSNESDDDDDGENDYKGEQDNESDGQEITTRSNSIISEIHLKPMQDELEAKLVFVDAESLKTELKVKKTKKLIGPILNEVPSSLFYQLLYEISRKKWNDASKICRKLIYIQPQNKSYIEYYHLLQSLIIFSDKRHTEVEIEVSEGSSKSEESSGSHTNSHTTDSSSKSSDEEKKKKAKKPPKVEVKRSTKKPSEKQVKLSTKEITTISIKPSNLKEEKNKASKKKNGIKMDVLKNESNAKETLAEETHKSLTSSSASSSEEVELNETISVHTKEKEPSERGIDDTDDDELTNEIEND